LGEDSPPGYFKQNLLSGFIGEVTIVFGVIVGAVGVAVVVVSVFTSPMSKRPLDELFRFVESAFTGPKVVVEGSRERRRASAATIA